MILTGFSVPDLKQGRLVFDEIEKMVSMLRPVNRVSSMLVFFMSMSSFVLDEFIVIHAVYQ